MKLTTKQAEKWFNEAMDTAKTMFFPYLITQKGKFILYLRKRTWNYVMLNKWILEKAQEDKTKEDFVVRSQLFALFSVTLGLGLLIMALTLCVFLNCVHTYQKICELWN
jgi:hypothetical protein